MLSFYFVFLFFSPKGKEGRTTNFRPRGEEISFRADRKSASSPHIPPFFITNSLSDGDHRKIRDIQLIDQEVVKSKHILFEVDVSISLHRPEYGDLRATGVGIDRFNGLQHNVLDWIYILPSIMLIIIRKIMK